MTKDNKIIKDLKERNRKLSRQYRERDIRCFTLERQIEEMKEDIAFCLVAIDQEAEMSTDERTRSEMESCLEILGRWCK